MAAISPTLANPSLLDGWIAEPTGATLSALADLDALPVDVGDAFPAEARGEELARALDVYEFLTAAVAADPEEAARARRIVN